MNGYATARRISGITLLESLLAATLLAAVVTSVIWPFTAGAQNELAGARSSIASELAQELMEEILSKPFDDPQGAEGLGPDAGEATRDDFDNIDDYHGYGEPAGQILCFDGEAAADPVAADLSRSVATTYVYVSGQDTSETPSFISVTVTVSRDGEALVELTRLVYSVQQ